MGKLQERATPATEPPSGARFIALTQGRFAIVDEQDRDQLARFNWFAIKDKHTYYAVRNVKRDGKPALEFMHRVVAGTVQLGIDVDHRDGDGLNNRRSNLRECSVRNNRRNVCHVKAGKTSRWKGVYLSPARGGGEQRWRAAIKLQNGKLSLGSFANEYEAARAYDRAALEHFGEFAALNFGQ